MLCFKGMTIIERWKLPVTHNYGIMTVLNFANSKPVKPSPGDNPIRYLLTLIINHVNSCQSICVSLILFIIMLIIYDYINIFINEPHKLPRFCPKKVMEDTDCQGRLCIYGLVVFKNQCGHTPRWRLLNKDPHRDSLYQGEDPFAGAKTFWSPF